MQDLLHRFSFVIVPMLNPDGVVCGLYRPQLHGEDQNRIWPHPDEMWSPEPWSLLQALRGLSQDREILFFLDFHGHTVLPNCFAFGYGNAHLPELGQCECAFPRVCSHFNEDLCIYRHRSPEYEGTARVVIRRRFRVLMSYTLEMSFGGSKEGTQFTRAEYREIGASAAMALRYLFVAPRGLTPLQFDQRPRPQQRDEE
jgi:hypothetical protein